MGGETEVVGGGSWLQQCGASKPGGQDRAVLLIFSEQTNHLTSDLVLKNDADADSGRPYGTQRSVFLTSPPAMLMLLVQGANHCESFGLFLFSL